MVGYAALALGVLAAIASALLAMSSRARGGTSNQAQAAADAEATISLLADTPDRELTPWESHASEVARQQLSLSLQHSAAALRQSALSFRIGMTAASLGFLAVLGSLGWLLSSGKDIAWLGVISGVVCEAVAALFFAETRATRSRTAELFQRAQDEADRVVRARTAMSVVETISDPAVKAALLADIGRWLLGKEGGSDERP